MASKAQRQKGWLLPEELTGYPTICVQFQIPNTPEYRAAARGAIYELTRRWNWEWQGKGDYKPRDAAQIFRELIDETLQFNDECGQPDDDSGCIELPLNHPSLEWNPNDPFRTPNLVPGGYAFPPWYKANSITGITLGTSLGDIVTDITRTQSIPVIPPSSGYPRLRIHLKGEGVLQLRLVQLNGGGYAQITTDDDILTVEIFALNKDVISIPPETSDDVIIEREISGTGDHHVDVLFIPRLNDELLPPITQGGAVRGIKLCGFDEMFKPCPDCPEPEPCEECEDCEDFIEDEIGLDLEELEMLLDCYKNTVGDIKMSAIPTVSGGWLLCDGTMYEKLQYPELAAALAGLTESDDTMFAVPDFSLKSPMGTGFSEDFVALQPLMAAGALKHQLAAAEMPEHDHSMGSHTHDVPAHSHAIGSHTHEVGGHTHPSPAHTHSISVPTHTHGLPNVTVPARSNSAAGSGSRLMRADGSGTQSDMDIVQGNSLGQTLSLSADSVAVQANTPFNTSASSGSTGNSAVLTTSAASGTSGSAGGDEAHANVHPVLGVLFYIFAGCAISSEDCL